MAFEIQAHRGNDVHSLHRLLAAGPTSVEIDVGLTEMGAVVAAHEPDLSDASGLTLAVALELAGETPVIVEVKSAPPLTASPETFSRALAPFLPGVAVASFDERVLVEVRRRRAATETTFLFAEPLRVATSASTLGPREDVVTAELVHAAHALGLRVVPWTVNDP